MEQEVVLSERLSVGRVYGVVVAVRLCRGRMSNQKPTYQDCKNPRHDSTVHDKPPTLRIVIRQRPESLGTIRILIRADTG